jgi:hypothetical protein
MDDNLLDFSLYEIRQHSENSNSILINRVNNKKSTKCSDAKEHTKMSFSYQGHDSTFSFYLKSGTAFAVQVVAIKSNQGSVCSTHLEEKIVVEIIPGYFTNGLPRPLSPANHQTYEK